MATSLYKDGNSLGIKTNAKCEEDFLEEVSALFDCLITRGDFAGDWVFQLVRWLEQIVSICARYRRHGAVIWKGEEGNTRRETLIGIADCNEPKVLVLVS